MAIIDCCTREIVAWHVELRCRADEAIALIQRAALVHAIEPNELTLGSDNGSAFSARRFKTKLAGQWRQLPSRLSSVSDGVWHEFAGRAG